MVLHDDRRTAAATAGERGPAHASPGFSVVDVGRALLRERKRQGMSLQDVGARTGIPVVQLRAAETGVLDRPDGLSTLKTVRRYADFLGLPGDRFALAILERWPTKSGVPHPFGTASRNAVQAGPFPDTGPAPWLTGPAAPPPPLGGAWYHDDAGAAALDAGYPGAFSDTGLTPAVPARVSRTRRARRRGAPPALHALVVVVVLAVLGGVGLLAVHRYKPSWLRDAGLTHPATAGASSTPPGTGVAQAGGGSVRVAATSTVLRPSRAGHAATFVVPASAFTSKISARGGPCWVEVTTDTSSSPAFTGVVEPGSPRTFTGLHSLLVDLGSSSGRLSITSSGGHVTAYAPPSAPYRIAAHTRR